MIIINKCFFPVHGFSSSCTPMDMDLGCDSLNLLIQNSGVLLCLAISYLWWVEKSYWFSASLAFSYVKIGIDDFQAFNVSEKKKKKTVVVYKVLWIDIWAGYTSLRFDIHIMTTHHSSLLIKLLWTQGCGIYQVRCKHDPVAVEFMIPVGKITVKTQILIFIWILCTLKLLNKVTCIFQSISF